MKLSIRLRNALVFAFLMVSTLMPGKMGIAQGLTYVKTLASPSPKAIGEETLIHSNGNIYVTTYDAIYVYNQNGEYVKTIGSYGSGQLQWRDVHGICELANGNLLIAEFESARLQEITPDGAFVRTISFPWPQDVAALPDGGFAVTTHFDSYVAVFSPEGTIRYTFPTGQYPTGLLLDSQGDLHVALVYSGKVQKYSIDGTLKSEYGFGKPVKVCQLPNGHILVQNRDQNIGIQSQGFLDEFDASGTYIGRFTNVVNGREISGTSNSIDSAHGLVVIISDYEFNNGSQLSKTDEHFYLFSAIDEVAPTSTLSANPSTTWSNTNITATITSTDNPGGTGVKEIHYSINMGAEQIVSASTATFALTETGTHSISYFAVDNAGNTEATKLATVKIDKIAPVTTLTRNAGLITLSATDTHSGVAKIKYQVNGGVVADYSVPFADTIHKVTYWAEDVAGNLEASITDIINAGVQAISVTQPRLNGGTGVVGTVTLDKAAGVGGTVINLASSLPGVAVVDATVTVPEGSTTATFDIDANPVAIDTSVSITASIYETSQSALVTVQAPMPSSLTWSVSPVVGGTSTTGTLTLTSPAPTGGTTVSLASSSLSALVGSSVTIPAGAMTTIFTVSTNVVSNDTSAVISATVYGVKLKSTLSILGPKVTSVTLAASSIASTTATTGTITLSTNAPVGGKVVNLSSSNASVASVPVSVTVVAGTRTATFTITAGTVNANTNATITATTNNSTGTATITVTPPAAVLSTLTTVVTVVTGGLPVTGTVTLTSAAPTGGAVVTLASSSTTIGTVPASVTVAAGATSATFTITTRTVTAASSLTITATRNGVSKTATITVNPVRVVSTLTLNPTSVRGGTNSTGTVTLSGIATEAVVVTLTSGTTAVARVPTSVTVPAGSTTATFTITTLAQTATRTSVITARTGTTSRTATLSVTR